MAFRVTRRAGEAAFTPEYQAATTVRSKAKASTATAIPRMVSAARSGCRTVLRQVSFSIRWSVASGQWSVFYGGTGFPAGAKYMVGRSAHHLWFPSSAWEPVTRRDALRFARPTPSKGGLPRLFSKAGRRGGLCIIILLPLISGRQDFQGPQAHVDEAALGPPPGVSGGEAPAAFPVIQDQAGAPGPDRVRWRPRPGPGRRTSPSPC